MFGSNNGIKPGFRRAPERFQSGARQVLPQPAAPTPVTQMPGGKRLPPMMDAIPPTPTGPMPRAIPLPAPTGPMTGTPSPMIQKSVGMKKGGKVKASSASKRGDGIAQRGKTKGKMI